MKIFQFLLFYFNFLFILSKDCYSYYFIFNNYRNIFSNSFQYQNYSFYENNYSLLLFKNVTVSWQLHSYLISYYSNYNIYLFSSSLLYKNSLNKEEKKEEKKKNNYKNNKEDEEGEVEAREREQREQREDNNNNNNNNNESIKIVTPSYNEEEVQLIKNIYLYPYTTTTLYYSIANIDIVRGTELTRKYDLNIYPSSDLNLKRKRRKKTITNDIKYLNDYENIKKYCLSYVYIQTSNIVKAGKGVFTKYSFYKGEILTIAPVFILPLHEVIKTIEQSLLINYCFTLPNTDIALLPTTEFGMMNHGGIKNSNIEIRWNEDIIKYLNLTIQELENEEYPLLEFSFVALRDIQENEELLIDYGINWERKWIQYIHKLEIWLNNNNDNEYELLNRPQFRSIIELTNKNMFPSHWYNTCIGETICETENDIIQLKDNYEIKLNQSIDYSNKVFYTTKKEVLVEVNN